MKLHSLANRFPSPCPPPPGISDSFKRDRRASTQKSYWALWGIFCYCLTDRTYKFRFHCLLNTMSNRPRTTALPEKSYIHKLRTKIDLKVPLKLGKIHIKKIRTMKILRSQTKTMQFTKRPWNEMSLINVNVHKCCYLRCVTSGEG